MVLTVLSLILVGLAFLYLVPDYKLLLVRSESMTPAVKMGDLIITGPVGGLISGEVAPGAIITYKYRNELITHRVESIEGEAIVTKGDAVENADPWLVEMSAVRGVYMFKIPYVGYVTSFVQSKLGWFFSIIIPAALLVAWLVKDILKEAFSDRKKQPSEQGGEDYG